MRVTCPAHLVLDLIALIISYEVCKLRSSSLCSLLRPPAASSQIEMFASTPCSHVIISGGKGGIFLRPPRTLVVTISNVHCADADQYSHRCPLARTCLMHRPRLVRRSLPMDLTEPFQSYAHLHTQFLEKLFWYYHFTNAWILYKRPLWVLASTFYVHFSFPRPFLLWEGRG